MPRDSGRGTSPARRPSSLREWRASCALATRYFIPTQPFAQILLGRERRLMCPVRTGGTIHERA